MSNINNLYEQFKKAKGYIYEERDLIEEFIEWIGIQKEMGSNYIHLLSDLGISYDSRKCAEIGKGKYDSVVKECKTTIITTDEDIKPNGMLINTGFKVFSGVPTIIEKRTDKKITFGSINPNAINMFMTHNPYDDRLIDNWEELPNNNINIVVGIFGSIKDLDLKEKIEKLKNFKEKICQKCIYERVSYNDTYCAVVASTKVKRIGV